MHQLLLGFSYRCSLCKPCPTSSQLESFAPIQGKGRCGSLTLWVGMGGGSKRRKAEKVGKAGEGKGGLPTHPYFLYAHTVHTHSCLPLQALLLNLKFSSAPCPPSPLSLAHPPLSSPLFSGREGQEMGGVRRGWGKGS